MSAIDSKVNIEIDKNKVYHYLGYGTDHKPPARVISLVNEYVDNSHHLIEPAYSYTVKNIEQVEGSTVFVENSIVFRSQVISQLLEQCCKVAVFIATIGNRLEEIACRLAENGVVFQSAALDAIGSNAVEGVVDLVQERIEELANVQGFYTGQRFSPGYCDWDIDQQEMIFRAMDGNSAGTSLTKECLMIPRKSISGIIGIGPFNSNVKHYDPCETCDKHDCQNRRNV